MMGPRSPIIKSGPQAISCGQREVPAAMARLAKVIVPTRVPTLPSRPRTASKSSGLVVALSDPDGDPQLSHWHRSMSLGQVIDPGSRFDPAMPLSGSPSIKLLHGPKARSASTKSVARCACLGVRREAPAGRIWPYGPNGALRAFFGSLTDTL